MANNELSLSSLGIQLPYNMQAEQSVLGAALMDETILNRLITEMDPDMFYSEQNRAVYEEMRRLFSESEAVDVITLVDSLAQNGVFKGADDAKVYITRIAETVPAISNVDSYIKIVKEKYQTRRLIEAARDILQQSSEESDSDLLLESAEQKLYDIRNGQDRSGVKTIQESILEVIDTMLMNGGEWNGCRLLKPETVQAMAEPLLNAEQRKIFVGQDTMRLGMSYGHLMSVCVAPEESPVPLHLGEYGWDGKLGTLFTNDPATRSSLLMMLQRNGPWDRLVNLRVGVKKILWE